MSGRARGVRDVMATRRAWLVGITCAVALSTAAGARAQEAAPDPDARLTQPRLLAPAQTEIDARADPAAPLTTAPQISAEQARQILEGRRTLEASQALRRAAARARASQWRYRLELDGRYALVGRALGFRLVDTAQVTADGAARRQPGLSIQVTREGEPAARFLGLGPHTLIARDVGIHRLQAWIGDKPASADVSILAVAARVRAKQVVDAGERFTVRVSVDGLDSPPPIEIMIVPLDRKPTGESWLPARGSARTVTIARPGRYGIDARLNPGEGWLYKVGPRLEVRAPPPVEDPPEPPKPPTAETPAPDRDPVVVPEPDPDTGVDTAPATASELGQPPRKRARDDLPLWALAAALLLVVAWLFLRPDRRPTFDGLEAEPEPPRPPPAPKPYGKLIVGPHELRSDRIPSISLRLIFKACPDPGTQSVVPPSVPSPPLEGSDDQRATRT